MVVRLGSTAPAALVAGERYRIRQGQVLQLRYVSDVTPTIRAWARVRYDNGEDDILFVADSVLNSDRVETVLRPSDVARMDGWVTDALVEMPLAADSAIRRGQVYVRLYMNPFGAELCSDYCYAGFGQVALGTYVQSGPGGGSGNLFIQTLKANGAPATLNFRIRSSNTIKLVRYFIWYYHCSSTVATRVIQARVTALGGALPTDYDASGGTRIWNAAALTLTADQDGFVFADTQRSGINDNGTITIDDQTTAPTPLPLLVTDDDELFLAFTVTDDEVTDFEAIYAQIEEWVVMQD